MAYVFPDQVEEKKIWNTPWLFYLEIQITTQV